MNSRSILFAAMLLATGPALAQVYVEPAYAEPVYAEPVYAEPAYLDPVVVRPMHVYMEDGAVMSMSCGDSYTPSPIDVESLLQINDRTQTQQLTNKLMAAVEEACYAGVPAIVVERGKSGQSLTWRPADDPYEYEQTTVTN